MKNAAFLLLSVGMVGCSGEVSSNKTKAQQYVDSNRITASVMAQDFVQSELRSPSTASTGWQVATNTTFWVGEKEWISVFWMDATNGFGATVREGFVVMVTDHGDTWRLVGIKRLDHKQVQDEQLLARALERDAIAAANGLEQATVAAETEVKQPIDHDEPIEDDEPIELVEIDQEPEQAPPKKLTQDELVAKWMAEAKERE